MTTYQEIVNTHDNLVLIESTSHIQMCYSWYTNASGLKAGIVWHHELSDGGVCGGVIPILFTESEETCWVVESYWPLTLSPSIICKCELHGSIMRDKWVAA